MNLHWSVGPGRPATLVAPHQPGTEEALAWLAAAHDALRAGLREHGAVYIRGLPVHSAETFAQVRDVLLPQHSTHRETATPRGDLGHDARTTTNPPAGQSIRTHNENSYALTFPGLLLFGCLTAPEQGGATPVADCRSVLRYLPSHLVDRMRTYGWLLTRTYSDRLSANWRSAFGTDSPAEVERYCAENLIACDWRADGGLRTRRLRPGVVRHPETGEEVWFNHMAFWNEWSLDEKAREILVDELGHAGLPFHTGFGDGLPLTRGELYTISAAYEAATVRRAWEPGDLMLVDNIRSAHGRDPFRGDRRIMVATGAPVALADCRPAVEPAAAPFPAPTRMAA
ncbi:SyrP [Streptomyces eurocidicus]|uniref:Alpha-ketoglutarate-dependent taurine dioxygenase n=1 Tax=Streptomyces eurocidicus TaxID=66423 RepID=A0A2N8P088_STREU|nr:TauD/TfdA family dioxygenase [Streptomyces eurocidicus]MBB5118985.1 alpha-ketoglutarate-dependent taurine dioxygenase [Streptomyces eurocidicus]MBF6051208.1 TauD/TfdA family dioxygenase [Streptomyces eurocidicus]PNE34434.1 SyrP [Streptomyces eurocidicus]